MSEAEEEKVLVVVDARKSGLFLTLSVNIRAAVSGEWARLSSECAGCEGIDGVLVVVVVADGPAPLRGEAIMANVRSRNRG